MKKFILIICAFILTGAFRLDAQKAADIPTGKKFFIQSAINYGKNNGGYWDVPGYPKDIKKGSNIQVYNFDNNHDRTFSMHFKSSDGYYEIKIGNTRNSRIDIQGANTKNGTSVKTWTRNHQDNQKFLFEHQGNGRFKIFDKNSGKVICLAGRSSKNRSNVHIWDNHNGPWMEWYLIDAQTRKAFVPGPSKQKITEVKIGEQIWMGENLNVSHFRNGDPIPHARTNKEWDKAAKEKKPAWCYLNNNPANGKKSGKLYNWFAVNDPRGLAPEGWHVPGKEEWSQLIEFLGGKMEAYNKLKAKSGWASYEIKLTNKVLKRDGKGDDTYGFTAKPGGYRWDYGPFDKEKNAYWLSSTSLSADGIMAYGVGLYYNSSFVVERLIDKDKGYSVRCVKNK